VQSNSVASSAFTLIELLVVIAIIGILVSLLLPALAALILSICALVEVWLAYDERVADVWQFHLLISAAVGFWLTFPANYAPDLDNPTKPSLVIQGAANTVGTVTIAALGYSNNFIIPASFTASNASSFTGLSSITPGLMSPLNTSLRLASIPWSEARPGKTAL
jgi:prepilin-type N-terminal cleavage/methylation domain-containing protein